MRPDSLSYNQSCMNVAAKDEAVLADPRACARSFGLWSRDVEFTGRIERHIRLTGSDRVRWLNGMVTNNIRDLAVGHGVYAFLLTPQGKIQADLYAFNRGESLVVETDRTQVETVLQIFDRYIIMDDVEVENLTGKVAVIGVAGAKAFEVLRAKIPALLQRTREGQGTLEFSVATVDGIEATVVRGDNPAVSNYEIWVSPEQGDTIWNALVTAGAEEVHDEALEALRIAAGIPKFGVDIRQKDLPQETGQDRALNFTKGCYVGQEIVERIRSRGAVHRMLTGFEVSGDRPSAGLRIQEEGKDVAEITSLARAPAENGERVLALGYGRREVMVPGREFVMENTKVRVATVPFAGIFSAAG